MRLPIKKPAVSRNFLRIAPPFVFPTVLTVFAALCLSSFSVYGNSSTAVRPEHGGCQSCDRNAGDCRAREKKLNSFRPGEIWPDDRGVHINAHGGGMLLYAGRYYWFGEHKTEGKAGNKAHVGVHCYSSEDLYNWKDEGIALEVSGDPESPIADGCILERPRQSRPRRTS